MEHRIARNRGWLILLLLITTVIGSRFGAFYLRFDFEIPRTYLAYLLTAIAIDIPIKLAVFYTCLLHRGWVSQLGLPDLKRIAAAIATAGAIVTGMLYTMCGPAFPRSVYVIDALLLFVSIGTIRVAIRLALDRRKRRMKTSACQITLIYGAGGPAATLIREVGDNPNLNYRIVGLIDDDPLKQKETVLGARVLGTGADLPKILATLRQRRIVVDQVLIAMPSATGDQMRNMVAACRNAGLICKTLPGIDELLVGKGLSSQIRTIELEDLLGREPVVLDSTQIQAMIEGTRVLVTGAGGSIGSELCRQIAGFRPEQLILVDQAESDLFRIDMQLRNQYPGLDIIPELADVRSRGRVEGLLRKYRPQSVFHAAAYKHVPMAEQHVIETIVNNVLGTWNLCSAAVNNNVANFVMISSDKAVRPTNVMGASKRVAELVVGSFASEEKTKFVSVRFGNVLGSNGSVVPIFKSQIAAGGPVTVTHPEVRRYFMTVREAVQLVLQASTMGKDSEVYILDMGQPVRIVDLARNLIRLAGLQPDDDIRIAFTGLRPGEKLYEELITEGEDILPTYHKKIHILKAPAPDRVTIDQWLERLRMLIGQSDAAGVVSHLQGIVPEYTISENWQAAIDRVSKREPGVAQDTIAGKALRAAVS